MESLHVYGTSTSAFYYFFLEKLYIDHSKIKALTMALTRVYLSIARVNSMTFLLLIIIIV